MSSTDPVTGATLPADAIQRVLFVCSSVHVYQIPPLTSNKGYSASSWTDANRPTAKQIFTARLRILETAIPKQPSSVPSNKVDEDSNETVTAAILLEDPSSGQLFAGAPYNSPSVVEQAVDSSRFFAVRVQGEEGRKAVLGIGFEERADAIDFGIALQDTRKGMGLEAALPPGRSSTFAEKEKQNIQQEQKRDLSLKEGETITVNIGNRSRRRPEDDREGSGGKSQRDALFSIKPPPASGNAGGDAVPFLPPPPVARDVKAERRRSRGKSPSQAPAQESGFDDDFGDFQ